MLKAQEYIICPVPVFDATKVSGLHVDSYDSIVMHGDHKKIVEDLVRQYARLFGHASVGICKEAVAPIISRVPEQDVPGILK